MFCFYLHFKLHSIFFIFFLFLLLLSCAFSFCFLLSFLLSFPLLFSKNFFILFVHFLSLVYIVWFWFGSFCSQFFFSSLCVCVALPIFVCLVLLLPLVGVFVHFLFFFSNYCFLFPPCHVAGKV